MKPLDYITWTIGDITKDFGGKDPGIGRSLQDKKQYLAFISALTGITAVAFYLVGWWPFGVAFSLICIRKVWILQTIKG